MKSFITASSDDGDASYWSWIYLNPVRLSYERIRLVKGNFLNLSELIFNSLNDKLNILLEYVEMHAYELIMKIHFWFIIS